MNSTAPTSRCSAGKPIRLRWFGFPQARLGEDLEVASRKFLDVISNKNRDINQYVSSMAVAEFKQRIRMAQAGLLTPQREIKPIDSSVAPLLFEIRWQAITVRERNGSGVFEDKRLLVRMYHSEPEEFPGFFVAHHIHEKNISGDGSTWLMQNEEISTAIGYWQAGLSTNWGI
ncbi:hypothetical protein A1sIA53_02415 [Candidatus Planktophila dulcis]|uniref:hypothetical protein n=1 Tax=Candidatus Planktophila dulcis TaxID=1884914 RepID=UPI000BAC5551|nr:hypothetical protein [Candidatus Planktophila dulcis]ASY14411.1 hypothetical protein A1sIA53_02415 [Candidatus Planktophila dulcis]